MKEMNEIMAGMNWIERGELQNQNAKVCENDCFGVTILENLLFQDVWIERIAAAQADFVVPMCWKKCPF